MIYLLAAVGLATVAVLFWKAFGPDFRPANERRVIGPDDDPDFLWRLNRESRRSGNDETGPTDPIT